MSAVGRKLGKLAPKRDPRTLRLARYLTGDPLPEPPPQRDWSHAAAPNWGMMRNDQLGDCTCAAAAHLIQAWTANHGAEVTPSDLDVVAAYSAITGYSPMFPDTDNGAVELDVLNYWRSSGIAGHKIGAYASIEPGFRSHIQSAIDLFGGVYVGAALPIAAQTQTVWDAADDLIGVNTPGSWGGHAMAVIAYTRAGVLFVTWGALKFATWAWWTAYVDEAYAVLAPEWVDAATPAPSGFDLATLRADLAAL